MTFINFHTAMWFGRKSPSSRWMFSLSLFMWIISLTDPNDHQMMEMGMNGTRGGEAHFRCPVTAHLSVFYWKFNKRAHAVVECNGTFSKVDKKYESRGEAFLNGSFILQNLTDDDAGSYRLFRVIKSSAQEVCTIKLQVKESPPYSPWSPGSHKHPAGGDRNNMGSHNGTADGDRGNIGLPVGFGVGAVLAVGGAIAGLIYCCKKRNNSNSELTLYWYNLGCNSFVYNMIYN